MSPPDSAYAGGSLYCGTGNGGNCGAFGFVSTSFDSTAGHWYDSSDPFGTSPNLEDTMVRADIPSTIFAISGCGQREMRDAAPAMTSLSGYYLYMDSSVGAWGDTAMILSEIFTPDSRGHCFTFWYHMYGYNVGTLNLYKNNRTAHNSGNKFGQLVWEESGDQGDVWRRGNVYVAYREPFWFIFEFLKGAGPKGSIAIDDIHIIPGPCDSYPTFPPPHHRD
ncbi:MAM domain-containing glycosylphosphatidylinositol anchor protein 1-like, partial [Sinocyclocheilus rhinocerous]|uniref:MAM domain-containing glycosylphosphatidylinositol anchor protein 1-like n=1 Tax=Sinocyclocheilus rhinocerous TaxID=307959 RepID=UPI0007B9D1B7